MSTWRYDVLLEGSGPVRCDCGDMMHPTEVVAFISGGDGSRVCCLACAQTAGAPPVPVETVSQSQRSLYAYFARALACAVASKSFAGVGSVAITPAPIPETAPPVTTPGTPAAIARQDSDHE